MATPNKLTPEQREAVITWLAAEYSEGAILSFMRERGWPVLDRSSIYHYRESMQAEIDGRRSERRSRALETGLALKEERVERLKDHADCLEEIKWTPDDKGKLHNEKAWRETLDDIAKEVGHRRAGVDLTQSFGKMSEAELDDYIAQAERILAEGRQSGTALPRAERDRDAAPAADLPE